MFQNPEIDIGELPSVEAVEWRPLDPKLVRLMAVRSLISIAFISAIVAAAQILLGFAFRQNGLDPNLFWLWLVPLVVGIPSLTWPFVAVPRKGYAVRDKDIVFRTGVLWRTVTAVPFNRIQHVEKDSAPLDRRFGIANLKIFTAGGAGGDLKIDGLSADVAERLREFILDRVGAVVERH